MCDQSWWGILIQPQKLWWTRMHGLVSRSRQEIFSCNLLLSRASILTCGPPSWAERPQYIGPSQGSSIHLRHFWVWATAGFCQLLKSKLQCQCKRFSDPRTPLLSKRKMTSFCCSIVNISLVCSWLVWYVVYVHRVYLTKWQCHLDKYGRCGLRKGAVLLWPTTSVQGEHCEGLVAWEAIHTSLKEWLPQWDAHCLDPFTCERNYQSYRFYSRFFLSPHPWGCHWCVAKGDCLWLYLHSIDNSHLPSMARQMHPL